MHTKNLLTLSLATLLSLPLSAFPLAAQTPTLKQVRQEVKPPKPKLAPDLEEMLAQDDEDQRQALLGKTLAEIRQVRQTRKAQPRLNADETETQRQRIAGKLLPSVAVGAEEAQSFIVQTSGTTPNVVLQEKIAALGGRITQRHGQMGLLTIDAPRAVIRQLAADNTIAYVSPDRPMAAMGHVENTTGTAQIRKAIKGVTSVDGLVIT